MNRFTERLEDGSTRLNITDYGEPPYPVVTNDFVSRLAEYEDTGFDPEEIIRFRDELGAALGNHGIPTWEEMCNIISAKNEKRLLVFPCKIGDPVWFIPTYGGKALGMIRKDNVQMIGITSKGIHLKLRDNHDHNKTYMLGKTVFLTKEEAEEALKKTYKNKILR